ncbi:DUF2845 domain-containing protein [Ectothiorhodospira haloalkaliphila]|uniref:DUF2845 domain-containing protein n=1 Tax=Ectothiorhodospira haloalkaliphila TaxID=421628 RepID=UPI001EE99BA4|nr:DUF2845 domain-containing protein [Ectothiorhodospira haloalkaliphila]MCG5496245.1 DUF2845 domain-containing protein [Ectothiorhodospira variabilis]MCG5523748.1 DUF2845 domain-containing protein [Ectothiorhodospira haloalkaliphila]
MSTTSQASSLRFDGVLIREGSPAWLLLEHMGEPIQRSSRDACVRRERRDCVEWRTTETWFYRHNDLNYTIKVGDGKILKIEWSRF